MGKFFWFLRNREGVFVELSIGNVESFLEFQHFGSNLIKKILLVSSF